MKNTNTVLNETICMNTSGNNDYLNENESNSNHTTSILGFNSRIFNNCAECGLRIINLMDTCYAMGYLYHNSCFVCCCCKRTLRGKVFYKDQDKIYCEEDYLYCGFQQTVEKCFACGHIIAETILLAVGKTYHPGCFRCCICTKCLDGIPFTIDSNNLIYCLSDYHLINGPLCAVCGLVIMPDEGSNEVKRVVALGKEFHIDCYRCIDCKRNLGDESDKRCYPLNEPDPSTSGRIIQRLLCLNCHLQRIGAIPATLAGTSGNTVINTNNNNNNNSHHYTTSTNNIAVAGNHIKSNSGIISHANTTPISNIRYATMPNRIHKVNKLNTINTNQYYQHHPSNHSYNNNPSSSTSLLTHSYLPTTSFSRNIQHTIPNSTTSLISNLNHRNTTTNNHTSSSSSSSNNNYAINWEKTRTSGMNNNNNNNNNHNGNHSQYTNIH
ncbi:unnamed protein product [Schistosoma rodhaini]|uniref:LIM zinc-binding domain-containing protein n=1 Tax=Schistosoma rodhaini TaxID=6188 RepID=A0AA85GDT2_9TREM|nr:unnamed protein product [Schistosoma rodhaini]